MDPGGYNLPLSAYNTIEELDTKHQLTLRVRYSICAPQKDAELEDFKRIVITQQKKSESGFYKFNGLGENVVWSMYNNEHPTDHDKERLRNTLLWAAQQNIKCELKKIQADFVRGFSRLVHNKFPLCVKVCEDLHFRR